MSLPLVNDKSKMVYGRGHVSHLSQSIRSEHAYPLISPDDDNSHRGLLGQLTSYLNQHHRDTTLVVVREAGLVTVLPRSMNGQRLDIAIEMEKINCQVITYNLEVVKVFSQEPGDMSVVGKLVTEFLVDVRICPGLEDLGEQELDPLLDRLGRADIGQLLIEKFNGRLVYRARGCSFLIASTERVCQFCLVLSCNLKEKYFPTYLENKSGRGRHRSTRTKNNLPKPKLIMDIDSGGQPTFPEEDVVSVDDELDIFTQDGDDTELGEKRETKDEGGEQRPRTIPEDADAVCPVCVKTFDTKSELKIHFKKHTTDKSFPCGFCPKEFSRKAALFIHFASVHSELKSYLCDDCGAKFKANSALIDHRKRVHLQIKAHK